MTFSAADLALLRADDGEPGVDPPWSLREAPRSFEQHVEDLVSDLACLAPAHQVNRVAHELALAERMGIRSVWIHGLWRWTAGRWGAA